MRVGFRQMRTEHAQLNANHGAYQADGGERYTRPALLLVGYRPNHSPMRQSNEDGMAAGPPAAPSCSALLERRQRMHANEQP